MFLVSLFQRPDDVSLWFLRQGSYARSRQSDKERDAGRSPRPRDALRRTDHDRSGGGGGGSAGPPPQAAAEEKPQRVGDWSEHVSSSGKKYYYNCKSEVSQWEKPRDWVDWEKDRDRWGPQRLSLTLFCRRRRPVLPPRRSTLPMDVGRVWK